ncbi:MAG: ANTAR domain-containing protein [Gemmatimonadaceae bacterium]|jgi:response regulator NasT|nr:ANTAR domain-containing protein [Gemmatimonadaceae bacterium]
MPDAVIPKQVLRVLLAEDDEAARTTLVELLQAMGHLVVAEVASGSDAITQARDLIPDAVILDVHMPGATGVQAAQEIATALPGVAVLLVTGDASLTLSMQDAMATGAVALLPKPTPPGTLDSTLRLAVTRAQELLVARQEAAQAKEQLEHRKLIERAKGLLMRRTGASEPEAYRILQRTSQDRSVPMISIAKAILDSEPGLAAGTAPNKKG